jgi:hypothetical protein
LRQATAPLGNFVANRRIIVKPSVNETVLNSLLETYSQVRRDAPGWSNGCSGKQARKINAVHAIVQVCGLELEYNTALLLAVQFRTGCGIH